MKSNHTKNKNKSSQLIVNDHSLTPDPIVPGEGNRNFDDPVIPVNDSGKKLKNRSKLVFR